MKNGEIKVEKGVPVPPARKKTEKYPWESLKVGDSFVADLSSRNAMSGGAKRHAIKIRTQRVDETHCRVWRIA